MTTWTLRAGGTAPPATAWERYADTRQWSIWSPQIRSVRTDAGARIVPGLTGVVQPLVGPGVRFRVDEVDEAAMTWAWTVRLGPVRLRLVHGVEADGAGSSTWLRVSGLLPLVVGYAPLARLALGRLVRG